MHVPDHLLNDATELVAAASAATVVASVALRPERERTPRVLLDEPGRLGAGAAVAALVFGLQMVNVPVAAGTSGHLLGGALATALVGPRRALVAVSSVVLVQALLFADGGVGALGVNLWLIAVLPVAVAALALRLADPRGAGGPRWWAGVAVGAAAAPPVSAVAFGGLHAVGATAAADPLEVVAAMVRVHLPIGVAEAALTVAALGVLAVAGARLGRRDLRPLWAAAVAAAAGLSLVASGAPDGLERVTADLGPAVDGPGSVLAATPLADYGWWGATSPSAVAVAGLVGVAAAAATGASLAASLRPRGAVGRG